jgi:hypothetical protein
MKKIICWWFGCNPQRDYYGYPGEHCQRCGEEVSYSDLVGDTRHNRFKVWASWSLWKKWIPRKCPDCGRYFKCDPSIDHLPF